MQATKLLQISWEDKPLRISDKKVLDAMLEEVKNHGVVGVKQFNPQKDATFIKAFETAELPNCVICIFNSRKSMNEALFRASLFAETSGGKAYFTAGDYFSDKPLPEGKPYGIDRALVDYCRGNTPAYDGIRGYDLLGDRLNVFLDKAAQDTTKPAKDEVYAAMEAEFLAFLRILQKKYGDNYTFITSIATPDFISITSHEFLHAQYFTGAKLREKVDNYFNERINEPEIKLLVKFLKSAIYTTIEDDIYYRNNELFAYMLGAREYEDSRERKDFAARAITVLMHGTPRENLTPAVQNCFDEIYLLWQANNFAEGIKDRDALIRATYEIFSKYKNTLPETLDTRQSPFYKYLAEHDAVPAIVR